MNRQTKTKRLNAAADYLMTVPRKEFSMDHFCGTACCVAGHTFEMVHGDGSAVWDPKDTNSSSDETVRDFAKEHLGLSEKHARELFTPYGGAFTRDPWKSGPRRAARVVRHYAKTCVIDWDVK